MRKVFEHPAFHVVGSCKSLLDSHHIASTIRNENVSSLAGDIPFTDVYPELWIIDDDHYDEALALLRDFHNTPYDESSPTEWACPQCGQPVPGSLHACWACESPRPAPLPATGQRKESA